MVTVGFVAREHTDGIGTEAPSEQQMVAMPWAELKQYARSQGITLQTNKRRELIAAIVAERF